MACLLFTQLFLGYLSFTQLLLGLVFPQLFLGVLCPHTPLYYFILFVVVACLACLSFFKTVSYLVYFCLVTVRYVTVTVLLHSITELGTNTVQYKEMEVLIFNVL